MLFDKFLPKRKKYKTKEDENQRIAKVSYMNAMNIALTWLNQNPKELTRKDQIMLLDYLIDSILNDACASAVARQIYAIPDEIKGQTKSPLPVTYTDENGNTQFIVTGKKVSVDLSAARVYVRPWKYDLTPKKLRVKTRKDFERNLSFQNSYFFTDIKLCCVCEGNHGVNAGRYFKTGIITSTECDLTELYQNIDTDGYMWENKYTGKKEKMPDFRFAVIYELARVRHCIRNLSGSGIAKVRWRKEHGKFQIIVS